MKPKELRIVKTLPKIILPSNKNEMFINWYDEDLRFQDNIPKVFERGYILLENNFFNMEIINENFKKYFTLLAKHYKTTYRKIENTFNEYIELTKNTIIYFEFKDSFLNLEIYLKNQLSTVMQIDLSKTDKSKPNPKLLDVVMEMFADENKTFQEIYTHYCFVILQSCLWYLATTTKTTKYYRQEKTQPYYYEEKVVINPKKNKTITTPIYDMNKIRRVKVEGLIKRRKGWTYSHSFQVHGHFRHYNNGKVIFIDSYIKGKNKSKEVIAQTITLNPKI